jgi:hypothetical protein
MLLSGFEVKQNVCVVEFIPPLCDCCLFVVSALFYVMVAYEQIGYRGNNAIITT